MLKRELIRNLEFEKVKVNNRDKLIEKQSEANKELRFQNMELHRIIEKINNELKQYHFNSEEDLKNKLKTILANYQSKLIS